MRCKVEKTTLDTAKSGDTDFELKISGPRQQRYLLETSTDLVNWSTLSLLTITNTDGTATFHGPINLDPVRYFRASAQ